MKQMPDVSGSRPMRLISILIVCAFLFGDSAVVAWSAHVVSAGEVAAYGLAFALISTGMLVTAWTVDR